MKIKDNKIGLLIIHKDLPGNHLDGLDCWCDPFVIPEDTLLTIEQIIKLVSSETLLN